MRLPLYLDVVIASWAVFVIVWAVMAAGMKKTRKGSLGPWFMRVLVAAVVIVIVEPGRFGHGVRLARSGPARGWIAAALVAGGIGLAIWARTIMGRNWGMPMSVKQDTEIVSAGPYARIRHPIYTGMFVALVGSCLLAGSAWFAVCVAVAAYFFISARTEERHLLRELPDTYGPYMARTKMFVPFVV